MKFDATQYDEDIDKIESHIDSEFLYNRKLLATITYQLLLYRELELELDDIEGSVVPDDVYTIKRAITAAAFIMGMAAATYHSEKETP